ncbi:SANT [Nesidiocoris tenuis]|nr:SANT [Nesidiocoris tenuis]
MPSQSQMAYSRPTTLHGRPNQSSELCYKPNNSTPNNHGGPGNPATQALIASSSGNIQRHSPATYSTSYAPIRYMSYPPNAGGPGSAPGPLVSYRESIYSSRNPNVVNERGQPVLEYGMRGENMPSQSKPRISLLTSPEYMSSLSNRRHHQEDSYRGPLVPQNIQQLEVNTSYKKIRLGDSKSDIQRTLRIDTRGHTKQEEGQSSTVYTPQVEAISPTLPTEILQDESFRSTKDELLHGISKVDREITKTELQISKLMRKQQELEEAAKKPEKQAEEEEVPQPKHQSPAQKIYAENRRKAQEAHGLLKHLGPAVQLPIYNQPSDTAVYHENKMKHQMFKERLMLHLKKKHTEREMREKRLTATYSFRVQEWLRKVEKVENSQKRKAREMKNREFFEKVFPRLRKQREDRERFNRVGARVKSEADLEEIMDGLQEQEMEDKKMRSYAVVPPLLLDARQRSVFYINNNGRIDDFPGEYKERHLLNVWTQAEKDVFKEKFLQHPKNFGVIASYLEKKSVSDCVQHYYLSKKTENYKRLLRKSRVRSRSGRGPQAKVSAGAVPTSNSDLLSTATGVTTRFQREQLQKQEPIASTSTAEIQPPLINEAESNPPPPNFLAGESPPSQPPPLLLEHTEVPAEKPEEELKEPSTKKKKPKVDPETSDDDQYERPIGKYLPSLLTCFNILCIEISGQLATG